MNFWYHIPEPRPPKEPQKQIVETEEILSVAERMMNLYPIEEYYENKEEMMKKIHPG